MNGELPKALIVLLAILVSLIPGVLIVLLVLGSFGTVFWLMRRGVREAREAEAARQAAMQATVGRIAALCGGTVREHSDWPGTEYHITGEYAGRSVRVKMQRSGGEIQVKLRRDVTASLRLTHDASAAVDARSQLNRDPGWDTAAEQSYFFAPHVVTKARPPILRFLKSRWEQLTAASAAEMIQLLESHTLDSFAVQYEDMASGGGMTGLTATVVLPDGRDLSVAGSEQFVAGVLTLLDALATSMERDWDPQALPEGVSAAELAASALPPSLRPQALQLAAAAAPAAGPAVVPTAAAPAAPAQPATFAPGSPVLVAWPDGNRYPATLLKAESGQCLCSFPDGKQKWLSAADVSAATPPGA